MIMKELSIEEKARRYDEVIERAKSLLDYSQLGNAWIYKLLPEFRESEDERIRNFISNELACLRALDEKGSVRYDELTEAMTWFEKQGEVKESFISRYENKMDDESLTSEDEKIKKGLINYFNNFHLQTFAGLDPKKILAWLEKQGEDTGYYKPKFKQGDFLIHATGANKVKVLEVLGDAYRLAYEGDTIGTISAQLVDEDYRLYEPVEGQSESIKIKKGKNYLCTKTHKYAGLEWIEGIIYYSPEDYSLVNQGCTCYCPKYSKKEHINCFKEVEYDGCLEPKFHEGDWIIGDNTVHQVKTVIKNVSNGKYAYDLIDGGYISTSHEGDYHLWTIQDAKDGDVLATKDEIFIYSGRVDAIGRVCSHCGIYKTYNELCFTKSCFPYKKSYPATKEQRALLFQKMKEAGYEWDAEKKELKKIEQKSAWNEKDKSILEDIKVAVSSYWDEDTENTILDWIKSLEDRVQPQQKQEWSEEDESMRTRCIGILGKCYMGELPTKVEEELNWLKSLRPKNQWKPSEEQMKALEWQVDHTSNGLWQYKATKELLEQFKNL